METLEHRSNISSVESRSRSRKSNLIPLKQPNMVFSVVSTSPVLKQNSLKFKKTTSSSSKSPG